MLITIIIAILFLLGFAGFGVGFRHRKADDPAVKWFGYGVGIGLTAIAVIVLLVASYNRVEEGHVGIPINLGQAEAEVGAGPHFLAPWKSVTQMDVREVELTFNGDTRIESRDVEGADVFLDSTVQYELREAEATNVYRGIGVDYENVVVIPAIRSCLYNAPTSFTAEEALTTARTQIGEIGEECLIADLEPKGFDVIDVKIRDVSVSGEIQTAINNKVSADQALQQSFVDLERASVTAQQAGVEAFGISNAEGIVSCGGHEELDDEGNTIIVANDPCEEQFSENYLAWLWITNFADNDNIIFAEPGVAPDVMVDLGNTPTE